MAAGDEVVVGVNKYAIEEDPSTYPALDCPDRARIQAQVESLRSFKATRSAAAVNKALVALASTAQSKGGNVFAQVVASAEVGATHGEICGTLRRELGFGHVLAMV